MERAGIFGSLDPGQQNIPVHFTYKDYLRLC